MKLPFAAAAFSSVFNNENLLFAGGPWASATHEPSTAVGVFPQAVNLDVLTLEMARSAMTADLHISIDLLGMDYGYTNVFTLQNCGIVRGKAGTVSLDNPNPPEVKAGHRLSRAYIPPLALTLGCDRPVMGVRLEISGHGWHEAKALAAIGSFTDGDVHDWTPEKLKGLFPDASGFWFAG
ncbi:MAG: hypothetical protein GC129_06855 [Proteobacteria bacterium]|nr:hypothetical protein [Pseudomonadota bacterium]